MKSRKIVVLTLITVLLANGIVLAGSFYIHNDERYWWYRLHVGDNSSFDVAIPSDLSDWVGYLPLKKYLGHTVLEIASKNGDAVIQIGSKEGMQVAQVQQFVAGRWSAVLKDVTVLSNRIINTSNGLPAQFYALEATGPDGRKHMLRSVYFSKDDVVVYLVMFLPSAEYKDAIQQHWLRAVNESEWR